MRLMAANVVIFLSNKIWTLQQMCWIFLDFSLQFFKDFTSG